MKKEKILIVDDSPELHWFLGKLFKCNGYCFASAYDVETALEFLREDKPEVVVLDMSFSAEKGAEFLRRAKKHLSTGKKKAAVILLVSDCDKEFAKMAEEYGVYGIVQKPYNPLELMALIRNLMKEKEEPKSILYTLLGKYRSK